MKWRRGTSEAAETSGGPFYLARVLKKPSSQLMLSPQELLCIVVSDHLLRIYTETGTESKLPERY